MTIQSHDYFSREISTPSIGQEGLRKLQESYVAIIGAGGVGSAAAYYLSRSGVGHLKLIDQDIVEITNLQRLHGATVKDLYHPKAEVIADRLSDVADWCTIEPVIETVTDRNANELLKDADLIFDGLDNFRTRYTLNKSALTSGTPYLFASAIADQAHLALLNPPKTACLECIMPKVTDRLEDSCETLGVSPSITGLTGALGTGLALRSLLGCPSSGSDKLVTLDMAGPDFLLTKLVKRPDCDGCANGNMQTPRPNRPVTFLCGEHTANVLPPDDLIIEILKIGDKIPSENILVRKASVLVFRHEGFTVSLFRNGRLLIGGVEDEIQASKTAREISHYLGLGT
jgi:molybdopterin-synthase adenylyltransferase